MRIISGKHRGRKIISIEGKNLRPTMGVTREAIFNILAHGNFDNILSDAKVLDIFCGSGALSMESFSRGAASATLIDINQEHLDIAKENIKSLSEENNSIFLKADATKLPTAYKKHNLVFIDPPYNKNYSLDALISADNKGWLEDNALIIIETDHKEDITAPDNFTKLDERKYGHSKIHVLRKIK